MDALEFLMERNRLCGSYRGCVGCGAGSSMWNRRVDNG